MFATLATTAPTMATPSLPVGSPFRDVQWFTRDDLWRLNRDGQLLPLLSGGLESILGLYERGAPPGLSWDLDVRLAMLRCQIPEVGGGRQETRPIREGLLAKWAQLDRAYADLRAQRASRQAQLPSGWEDEMNTRMASLERAVTGLQEEMGELRAHRWNRLDDNQIRLLEERNLTQRPDPLGFTTQLGSFYAALLKNGGDRIIQSIERELQRAGRHDISEITTEVIRNFMANWWAADIARNREAWADWLGGTELLEHRAEDGSYVREPRIVREMRNSVWRVGDFSTFDYLPPVAAFAFRTPVQLISMGLTEPQLYVDLNDPEAEGQQPITLIRVPDHYVGTQEVPRPPGAPLVEPPGAPHVEPPAAPHVEPPPADPGQTALTQELGFLRKVRRRLSGQLPTMPRLQAPVHRADLARAGGAGDRPAPRVPASRAGPSTSARDRR